ncbi:hypothetical protein [Mycobacterium intracellulare]|uniref:Uncharacterized protein n=1 Tax=Mycobacterium intracellulare TaxID=1767 RepID=A0AAE4RFY0_MYCIT|nr:hypothetical protein [Mycobacterium intracellulare]MDV6979609.1 hypothetical protein [Mycobacterium intracellulare]MDV6985112.1 hypothetical protein [Mycobacterium intracellulare]MDV7014268.1 hypothetical protein [Mycobacterium intracellulare]MDV7030102.1 hypothetical protein [Mycobacterium intracellulare]
MTGFIQGLCSALAILALYAVCAALINQTNPYLAIVVLVVALVGLVDEHQTEYRHRLHMAAGRADVWARRDREAGR